MVFAQVQGQKGFKARKSKQDNFRNSINSTAFDTSYDGSFLESMKKSTKCIIHIEGQGQREGRKALKRVA